MSEQPNNNGELLLPVCISDDGMLDLISALDLYKILGYEGQLYPAFESVLNAIPYRGNVAESPCFDSETGTGGACYRMDTTTEIFEFYPNDPFDSTDKSQTIIGGSWITLDKILGLDVAPQWIQDLVDKFGNLAGYFPNDCFVTYLDDDFPRVPDIKEEFFQFLDNLSNVIPFPTVTIKINGSGQADLEFPIVPLGGRVIITKDFEPNLNDLADIINGDFDNVSLFVTVAEIERDLLSSTPEFIPSTVVELEFPDEGDHTIRCIFVPSIEIDQAPFIFPFGGIREIEVCGNIQIIGSQTGTTYTPLNYRNLEAHRRGLIGIMSVEDIRLGVHLGLIDTMRETLQGHSAGVSSSIEIDKDTGEIIVKSGSSGTSGLKPVVNGNNSELRNGGVYRQAIGIRDLLAEHASLKAGGFSALSIINISKLAINPLDLVAWSSLVTAYFNSAENIVIDAPLLAEHLYCNSFGVGVVRYAIAKGHTEEEIDFLSQFVSQIPASTLSDWYNEGASVPRTDYIGYACSLMNPFSIELSAAQWYSNAQLAYSLTHFTPTVSRLIRVKIEGTIGIGADNHDDGIYRWIDGNPALGNLSFGYWRNNLGSVQAITPEPLLPVVGGGYEFTYELPATTAVYYLFTFKRNIALPAWATGAEVGSIKLTMTDLGATS